MRAALDTIVELLIGIPDALRVGFGNGTIEALADWLMVGGNEPGPLFVPVNKGRHIVGIRRM